VARDEDRRPLCAGEVAQQLADLDDPRGVQPVRGLVQHQQLWLVQQRARQGEPLQVARRQRAGTTVGVLAEPQPLDDPIDRPAIPHPLKRARRLKVLPHAQLGPCRRCFH
jgi:hypothetical protein